LNIRCGNLNKSAILLFYHTLQSYALTLTEDLSPFIGRIPEFAEY